MQKLAVKYSCALCGLHRVTCDVEPRGDGQDITDDGDPIGKTKPS